MRFQSELSTYSHDLQRKKKNQTLKGCKKPEERNNYDYSFNLLNPEGTIHLLLKGDILTSYEQYRLVYWDKTNLKWRVTLGLERLAFPK